MTVTACVLRYHNVAYLLTPSEDVIKILVGLVPLATKYYDEKRRIAARQQAKFALERVQTKFPRAETERSIEGRVAHDTVLRRDS